MHSGPTAGIGGPGPAGLRAFSPGNGRPHRGGVNYTAIPGVVWDVYVPVEKVGKTVARDEPLFKVDTRALEANLAYAEANLLSAKAQLTKLEKQPRPEEVPSSEAKVRTAEANVKLQQDLADRAARLVGTRAIAEEDYRQRMLATEVARQRAARRESGTA